MREKAVTLEALDPHADEPDEWLRGFREARSLHADEAALERVIAARAWSWSPERLRGFLAELERITRGRRCTCCCPVHSDLASIAINPNSN